MSKAVISRITENLEVFTSFENRPFAFIPCPANIQAFQAVPLRSAAFRNWFFGEYLSHFTTVPSPFAFRSVLDLLEARAFRDPGRLRCIVHRRVGHKYAPHPPHLRPISGRGGGSPRIGN